MVVVMPERLDASRLLAALGAVILFVSLFLSWFKPDLTAWTIFEIVDLLLAVLATATLLSVFTQAVPSAGLKVPAWTASPWIGLLALLLVLLTIVNHPPAAVHGGEMDTGVWVGLAGALLMALGGLLGVGRVSLVITKSERRYRRPPPTAPVDDPNPPTESLGFEERPGAFPETDVIDEPER
jgi:hypothetical protein